METKALEIRDEGTFIAILAVDMNPILATDMNPILDDRQHKLLKLLKRCGYRCDGRPNILLTKLSANGKATNDPYSWGDRTMATAHNYILKNWLKLEDGDVIDVEYILGETSQPKESEA
jgi:hypothetical protein